VEEIKRRDFPYRLKPKSDEYRIIEFGNRTKNKYHLEAKIDGVWVDVEVYDEGIQSFRKFVDITDWKLADVSMLVKCIFDQPETSKVIETFKRKP
jgi:hypothetical protein